MASARWLVGSDPRGRRSRGVAAGGRAGARRAAERPLHRRRRSEHRARLLRQFYWRHDDPGDYRNRAGDAATTAVVRPGEAFLQSLPAPKPGTLNRPRALLPAAGRRRRSDTHG